MLSITSCSDSFSHWARPPHICPYQPRALPGVCCCHATASSNFCSSPFQRAQLWPLISDFIALLPSCGRGSSKRKKKTQVLKLQLSIANLLSRFCLLLVSTTPSRDPFPIEYPILRFRMMLDPSRDMAIKACFTNDSSSLCGSDRLA